MSVTSEGVFVVTSKILFGMYQEFCFIIMKTKCSAKNIKLFDQKTERENNELLTFWKFNVYAGSE
jgi:hypothetical protein